MALLTAKEFAHLVGKLPQHLDIYHKKGKIYRDPSSSKPMFDPDNEINNLFIVEMRSKLAAKGAALPKALPKKKKAPTKFKYKPPKERKPKEVTPLPTPLRNPLPSDETENDDSDIYLSPTNKKKRIKEQNDFNEHQFNVDKKIKEQELLIKQIKAEKDEIELEVLKGNLIERAPVEALMISIVREIMAKNREMLERRLQTDAFDNGWSVATVAEKRKGITEFINNTINDCIDKIISSLKKKGSSNV